MIDRYNYISPSRVKVLIVPIKSCSKLKFNKYLEVLRATSNEVRLLDVVPMPELNYFNPQTFPNGKVIYEFDTSMPDPESIFLHDLEPYRKTFVVIGIGSYHSTINKEEINEDINSLKSIYSGTIVQNLILFDTPEGIIEELNPRNDHSSKQAFFYGEGFKNKLTAMETIICDITRNFLFELDNYATSYSNITLRSPVSITNSHVITKSISQAQKRLSSGSSSFQMSFSNGPNSNNSQDPKSKSQQRYNGRRNKLMGNLYLIAGKYTDALNHFVEASVNLKKCDDFLWLGGAIEGISISITLLQYVGAIYQFPSAVVSNILHIPKAKLSSITSNGASDSTSIRRTSSDSPSTSTTPNGQLNIHHATNSGTSINSPRNSTSSFMSFGFVGQNSGTTDLGSHPLPEFVKLLSSRILYFYNLSTNDYENSVPDIVYVEFLLRTVKFMIGIYLSGKELTVNVLENIIKSAVHVKNDGDNSIFSKTEILREIDKIFYLQLLDMSIYDQCRVYCTLAGMYADLGLFRKRAFILRILLVSLLPKLESNSTLQPLTKQIDYDGVFMHRDDRDNKDSIREIFEYLFSVYLLDVESESTAEAANIHSKGSWVLLQISILRLSIKIFESVQDYEFLLKICSLLLTRFTHCLPTDDQLKVKEKIEWIIYISHRNNLSLSTPYWDPFLVRNVSLVTNRHRDELIPFLEYEKNSGSYGLDDIKDKADSNKTKTSSDIFNPYSRVKSKGIDKEKLLIKDEAYQVIVTLQNPFAFEIEINDLMIITEGDVKVQTLKNIMKTTNTSSIQYSNPSYRNGLNKVRSNPFHQRRPQSNSVSARYSQQPVSSNSSNSLIISPHSNQQFIVGFIPLSAGSLEISGLNITISNCLPQFFKIVEVEKFNGFVKIKNIGYSSSPKEKSTLDKLSKNLTENNISSRAITSSLHLTVVPPQPVLTLTNLSITNGWIMLLEGEKHSFSLSLTNFSDVLINFLSFSFWDSTIDNLNNKLSSYAPSSEIHEIEWSLLNQKPFSIKNKDILSRRYKTIEPHKELRIDIEVIGKKGMKESKIVLEYSHKLNSNLSGSYVKYVEVPINMSIIPSLEVISCDILTLFSTSLQEFEIDSSSYSSSENLKNVISFLSKIRGSGKGCTSDYCLFMIDLRNSWTEKLNCNLTYNLSSKSSFELNEDIQPGMTSRFLLPIKRISRNEIDLEKHIPSLRNKQFIKNYSISDEEETAMKEQFWLRDFILSKISGTWRNYRDTEFNTRAGTINLRSIKMSPKMVNILLYSRISIQNVIVNDNRNEIVHKEGSQYILQTEEFYALKTTITNHYSESLTGILRHLPIPKHISSNNVIKSTNFLDRKILINGVLQKHIGEDISPGSNIEISTSFIVLEKGEYEWATVFEVLNMKNLQVINHEPLLFSAS